MEKSQCIYVDFALGDAGVGGGREAEETKMAFFCMPYINYAHQQGGGEGARCLGAVWKAMCRCVT